MIFDCHMHTEFSSDSKMKIEDVIEKGNQLNIGTIITEHMDYNYPKKDLFKVDCSEFFNRYSKYRSDNLLLGIEIGLSHTIVDKNNIISNSYPFDFILGSIHSINDIDIFINSKNTTLSKQEYLSEYFEEMIKDISEFDNFDSLSHIDYPCRYLKYADNEIYLSEFSGYLDKIFSILLKKNKVIEVNTRRLGDEKAIKSLIPIYKRYKDLGGKYVTIGSDAHSKEGIGLHIDAAKYIIKEADLTPVYFKERKMHIINI